MTKKLIIIFIVSVVLSAILGYIVIPLLKKLKAGQNILCYLKEHFCKSGTPTMGGLFFVVSAIVVYFIFSKFSRSLSLLSAVVMACYAIVGFLDDFIKIKFCRNEGLTPRQKLCFQLCVAIISCIFAYRMGLTKIYIPFTKNIVDVGLWFIPICIFVFIATTNCVNLTDGLDGLAGSVGIAVLIFAGLLICFQTTQMKVYVNVWEYNNLAVLSISLAGAICGFLVYNTYKASVFMGDTGSLAIGGAFASIMIFSGNVLYIPILGIIFVLSGISVIVQVISYKLTKKRVFLMAPIHHHFQHKGHSESKIVFCYTLITTLMGSICILIFA